MTPTKHYLGLLARHRRYALGILALQSLSLLLILLEPLFLYVFVNEAVLKTNLNLLLVIVGAMICCATAASYLGGVARYHRARLGQIVLAELRRELFGGCVHQEPGFFARHPTGKLVAASTVELEALDTLNEALFWGPVTAAGVAAILALCAWIDPWLTLPMLAALPSLALFALIDRWLRRRNVVAVTGQSRLVGFLKQRLGQVETIQAFGHQRPDLLRLGALSDELVEARSRCESLFQLSQRLFDWTRGLVLALILWLGGARLIRDQSVSLGTVLAILTYARLAFDQAMAAFCQAVRGRMAGIQLGRIVEMIRAEPKIKQEPSALPLERARGEIGFEQVWFRYPDQEAWALQGIDLRIEPGQFVALVGLSGSGKSTLFRLLMRLHDPERGTITLDQSPLAALRLDDLRAQFGLALQQAAIFDGTVEENVRYGRETADAEAISRALRQALAEPFVSRLPAGQRTLLGEQGVSLSGGQAQRIALARVLLEDAPVLLLDEITSGLDAKTEAALQESLLAATAGRTTLVIAHRLSTILRADRIVVMDGGRIVQQGTHETLYQQTDGLYRFLFDRQFKGAMEVARADTRTSAPIARRVAG